jgi:hypothetical protein
VFPVRIFLLINLIAVIGGAASTWFLCHRIEFVCGMVLAYLVNVPVLYWFMRRQYRELTARMERAHTEFMEYTAGLRRDLDAEKAAGTAAHQRLVKELQEYVRQDLEQDKRRFGKPQPPRISNN